MKYHLAFTSLLFLLVAFTQAEEKTAKKVILSTEQIQKSLGITAWEISIPKSFGNRCRLRYEQFIGEKRALIVDSGIIMQQGDPRKLTVSIRSESGKLVVFSDRGGNSSLGTKPLKIVEGDGAYEGDWVDIESEPEVFENRIVLQKWSHQSRADMYNAESATNPNLVLATKTLSIVPMRK